MQHEIKGQVMQSVEITLAKGESVRTESGGMAWIRGDVHMETKMPGGLVGGLMRKVSGESFFMTTYTAQSNIAKVTFTPYAPGKIVPFDLTGGGEIIMQKNAFMVADVAINLSITFQRKLGAGFFGGEGFIMQRVSGEGLAFAEIPGEVEMVELAAGESIKVDPGHVAIYETTVDFDITRIKGVSNMLFGGEGLFIASLTGPGKVWLQTLTLQDLASRLFPLMPKSKGN